MTIASENVCKLTDGIVGTGGRAGTITGCTLDQFQSIFGEPHETGIDGKITRLWYFQTPRGIVAVYDYWWNGPNELSIGLRNGALGDIRAKRWAVRYFREHGLIAG